MPKFKCVVTNCMVEFPDVDTEIQKMMLHTHNQEVHGDIHVPVEGRGGGTVGQPKSQKIDRPSIPDDCSEVQWSFFTSKFLDYKRFYQLTEREDIFTHLLFARFAV